MPLSSQPSASSAHTAADDVNEARALAAPRIPRDLADSIAPRPWWASLWVWTLGGTLLVCSLMYALACHLGIVR